MSKLLIEQNSEDTITYKFSVDLPLDVTIATAVVTSDKLSISNVSNTSSAVSFTMACPNLNGKFFALIKVTLSNGDIEHEKVYFSVKPVVRR